MIEAAMVACSGEIGTNRRRWIAAIMLSIGIVLSGCHGNTAVRMQRYLDSGRRLSTEGKYREASIQFLNALRIDEDLPEAHYELAGVYEHMGLLSAARDELDRTVDVDPVNYKARIEFGKLLFACGRTDEAQHQVDAVLDAQPDNPEAHALLSAIASRRGQTKFALNEIRRSLELDPRHPAYHENLALLELGDPGKALDVEAELKRAVELDPKCLNSKLLLAAFYARDHRLPEAEKIGWDAVSTDPSSLTARANVAEVILQEGDGVRAEQVLRQAAKDFRDIPQAERILADYYAATGQFSKAESEFSTLSAKYPKDDLIQIAYIRVLIEAGDYVNAKSVLAYRAKRNSEDTDLVPLQAIISLNAGDTNDALLKLRDSASKFPQDAFVQYWLGKAALADGDLDLAQASFYRALDLNPAGQKIQDALAEIATERGDFDLLSEVAERTITASPGSVNGYVWRAITEMARGRLDRAEADLNTAMSISPQSWLACLQMGKLRLAEKRFPEADSLLERALAYHPDSVEALRLLVRNDLRRGLRVQAMDRVNNQIKQEPMNSQFYDLLARLQIQNGNLDQATATARKAIELNPADGEAVTLFGQLANRLGLIPGAIDSWRERIKQHPRDAASLAILGALEDSRGDLKRAEAYYRASLDIDPQQPIAANNLSYRMLLDSQNIDIALSLAEKARLALPDSPNTADTLAWAYYWKGRYQSARDLLESAINGDPDCALMHYHLGMVYRKLHDTRDAQIHLKQALSLAHDRQIARDVRTTLQSLG